MLAPMNNSKSSMKPANPSKTIPFTGRIESSYRKNLLLQPKCTICLQILDLLPPVQSLRDFQIRLHRLWTSVYVVRHHNACFQYSSPRINSRRSISWIKLNLCLYLKCAETRTRFLVLDESYSPHLRQDDHPRTILIGYRDTVTSSD